MDEGGLRMQTKASSEDSRQVLPADHPHQTSFRVTAVVIGLVFAAFGVIALLVSGDVPSSGPVGHEILGLHVNRTTGIFWIAFGALTILGAVITSNLGAYLLCLVSLAIMLVGLVFLSFYRTSANVVAYSVIDVAATWVLSLGVIWCGLHLFTLNDDTYLPRLRDRMVRRHEDKAIREDMSLQA